MLVVNCFQNTNFSEDSQAIWKGKEAELDVNCFQNTNFSEDSQEIKFKTNDGVCCELL